MQLRCGGIFNNRVLANFLQCVSKELSKSVNIWRRYGQTFGGNFFMAHDVVVHVCVVLLERPEFYTTFQ